MTVSNLREAAAACQELWSPRVIADINNTAVKVARIEGEFVWHSHEQEDEAFLVLSGELTIRYRDRDDVVLAAGDLHVVPRGIEHCPHAPEECLIVLIEQNSTAHTGKVQSALTRSIEEQRGSQ